STLYGNTYTDNVKDYIEVQSDFIEDNGVFIWAKDNAPYVVNGHVYVQRDNNNSQLSTLRIEDGTIVQFNDGAWLYIGHEGNSSYRGALQADGVTFTRSDATDTWLGIRIRNFSDDATTYLDNCTIEYAGDGIYCESSNPTITNTVFRYNEDGIEGDVSSIPVVEQNHFITNDVGVRQRTTGGTSYTIGGSQTTGNVFSGNITAGLVEENGASVVNAEYNYWNAASGPTHVDNPDGNGDAVMGQVNYVPFISMVAPVVTVSAGLFGNSLSWTHPDDDVIFEYTIERCCGLENITISSGTNSYVDQIDDRRLTSTYTISARDEDDNQSLWSSLLGVPNQLLDQPILVDSISFSSLALRVPENSHEGIVNYHLVKGIDDVDYADMNEIETVSSNDFSDGYYLFMDDDISEGNRYRYAIKASDEEGNKSSHSEFIELLSKLIPPSNLELTMISNEEIELNWEDNSDRNQGYYILRKIPELTTWTVLDTLGENATTYTDENNLQAGSDYEYALYGFSDIGAVSEYSNIQMISLPQAANTSYAEITSITENEGLFSDTVRINYFSEDPNGGYALSLDWQYSRDGTQWTDIADSLILDNPMAPPGANSILWRTRVGDNNLDHIEDSSVWFRMKLNNNSNTSSYLYSSAFHIDNNEIPFAFNISPIIEEQYGDISIEFISSDAEDDTLTFLSEYSLDQGLSWETGTTELISSETIDSTIIYENNSLSFDGVDDYVMGTSFDDLIFSVSNQMTISTWVKPSSLNSEQFIFTHTNDNNDDSNYGLILSEGKIYFVAGSGWFEQNGYNMSENLVEANNWHHIVATYDGEAIRFYLNGELDFENYVSDEFGNDWIGNFHIGQRGDGNYRFNGNIDEITIWNTALSQSEIQSYISTSPTGSEENLVGYWNFNSGIGTTLVDQTSNGNNGTIYGATWDPEGAPTISDSSYSVSGNTNTVLWQSTEDLPTSTDNSNVFIRVTPYDADPGTPVTTAGIHIDYNEPPTITLEDIYVPQIANVTISYTISDVDGDTIDLYGEYDAGDGWQPATVLGAVSNVTVYDSSLTWFSMYDLGTEFIPSVKFRVTPSDNDVGTLDETLPMLVNNENIPPGANVFVDDGEQGDTIQVDLVLISPNIQAEQLATEYSINLGTTWQAASMFAPVNSGEESFLVHQAYWLSSSDLPEFDQDSVLFRFFYEDTVAGEETNYISNYFSIDNNTPPWIVLNPLMGEQSDTIQVFYQLSDIALDTLSIVSYFSLDDGESWIDATVIDSTGGISSGLYSGSLRWDSALETEGIDAPEGILFKVVPFDEDPGTVDQIEFHLDNNRLPAVTIGELEQEMHQDIEISFESTDPEDDSLDFVYEFSPDNGQTWSLATLLDNDERNNGPQTAFGSGFHAGPLSGKRPPPPIQINSRDRTTRSGNSGRSKSDRDGEQVITWKSGTDLSGLEQANALFRITPVDADTGTAGLSARFIVDNWQNHFVNIIEIPDEVEDTVSIQFTLSDSTGDQLNTILHYSIDGQNWTLMDTVLSIDKPAYDTSFTWASRDFLEYQDIEALSIKAQVFDQWGFGSSDTILVHLDNNYLPILNITSTQPEISDEATFLFEVINPEEEAITFESYYSIDDGVSWLAAEHVTNFMIDGEGTSQWQTGDELPDVDLDNVRLKLVAFDTDEGIAGTSVSLNVDNSHVHSVNLLGMTGEQTQDITLTYSIQDSTFDSLNLVLQYRIVSDDQWNAFDTITGILPNAYSNNWVWDSELALDGIDDSIQVMAVPTDGWQNGSTDMITFHLDNNDPPQITIDPAPPELSGNVDFGFEIFDPEDDEATYDFQFFNGQEWSSVTENSVSQISEIFRWNSRLDLDGLDIDDVQFAVLPIDNDPGISDTTNTFNLDNSHFHSVTLDPVAGEQTGPVSLVFEVADETADELQVNFYYKLSGSDEWVYFYDEDNIAAPYEELAYTWDTEAVNALDFVDDDAFMVMATPTDGHVEGNSDSITFHLDNNELPTVEIDNILDEQHGDITITFELDDVENDTVGFTFEYRFAGGEWNDAFEDVEIDNGMRNAFLYRTTLQGLSTIGNGIHPMVLVFNTAQFRDQMSITWHSLVSIPDQDELNVEFRITPYDNVLGYDEDYGASSISNSFHVDNIQSHTVELTDNYTEESGDINLNFIITDTSSDTLGLTFEYSIDLGQNWSEMSISGQVSNIGPVEYSGQVTWETTNDVDSIEVEEMMARATVYDPWADGGDNTIIFHLDNNDPPSGSLDNTLTEEHGSVAIDVNLSDDESDIITFGLEYSLNDIDWTIIVESLQLSYNDYYPQWNYTWESDDAGFLPGQEQPTVSLRMSLRDGPTDNDTSIVYLGYSFTIDNDQGQTIEMAPISDEQIDSVLISFTINDATNDTLDLTFEYSVDPGTWDVISLMGDTSNINSNGSVTWLSMADLPGLESYDVQLRAVAHDGWGAGAYDTVTVH
ncbi:MAG: hypothetical protein HON27_05015, partial [Candidatus Marinimicrobia bacterium]|nr:hypothetical protein [Candidatus Neomarinimicrobiota bacterium]